MKICKRFVITGRVQGVGFRAACRRVARAHHLTGYARNLVDGRVEVLACGTHSSVAWLERWLARGPPLAQVSEVASEVIGEVIGEEASLHPGQTFEIR